MDVDDMSSVCIRTRFSGTHTSFNKFSTQLAAKYGWWTLLAVPCMKKYWQERFH